MQGIIDFLGGLADIIASVFDFLIGIVTDLLYVVGLLGTLLLSLPDMIGWLPSACITLTVTTFAIVVIYKILGREG